MTDYLALARGQQPQDAAPDDAGNPYAALAREDQQAKQRLARTVLDHALKDNPETAAERQRLSSTSGLPLRVVERNLDEVRRREQLRAIDLARMAQDSPVLARQLIDPTFTQVAVDDLGTLAGLETAVGKAVRYVMGAAPGGGMVGDMRASLYRGAAGFAGAKMAAIDVVEPWARLVAGDDNWFAQMSRYYADQAKAATGMAERLSPPSGSVVADGVSAGVQSLGQNLKYLPLALAGPGGAAVSLGGMVMESFGASYAKAADKNLPLWQSLGYASADAMVEYWTEKIPMDALIGGIRQGAPFIRALGKQLALEIPGEQLATVLQDLNEWATLNPGRPFMDYLAERPDAAAQTLIATVIGTGGNVAVAHGAARVIDATMGSGAWRERLTEGFQSLLDEQLQLAGQSLLRERSPQQFRAMVQRVVDENDGAPKTVYVDGEVLNQMPAEVLDALPPEVREQIPAAAAAGTSVAIPMADVLTVAPGTPLEQALAEHARMDPFALSPAEVKAAGDQAAALKLQTERVVQQASDQEAWRQSTEVVRSSIETQITATGRYRPAVAEGMSHWASAFYSTMAARTGMTPEAFAAQYPLRILAEASTPGQEVIEQGVESPAFRAWFGGSKVVDEAGAPRVMYHGTGADLTEFRPRQANAIFVTAEPIFAHAYADTGAQWLRDRGQDGAPRIMPVYVKAENPFDYESAEHRALVIELALQRSGTEDGSGQRVIANDDGSPSLWSAPVIESGLTEPTGDGNWLLVEQPWMQDAIKAAGFDSFHVSENGFKNLGVYDPAQIKSAVGNRGTYDPNDPSILRQREQTRDLLIQHNLTAENLLHAQRMGGIPVPSLAVTKAGSPMESFGEITLIGSPEMADPKGYAGTRVYGADIYSPRYPSVEFNLDRDALNKVNAILGPFQQDERRAIYGDSFRRVDDITSNRAFKRWAAARYGVDETALTWSQLKSSANALMREIGAKERIYQGFTNSGNRRYIDHTLDNVIKILKKELRGGESFNYGVGSLRAKFTPQFKSLAQVRKEKGRLVDRTAFDAIKKEIDDEFIAISESLDLSLEQTAEVFEDAPKMGVKRAIERALRDYKQRDGEADADDMAMVGEFLVKLRNLPTQYFEAKILRAVDVAEFSAAVVPASASEEVLKALADRGVTRVAKYDPEVPGDRADKIQQFSDLFFQQSGHAARGTFNPRTLELVLSPTADLSTFFHETGHFYLEVLADVASQPNAPQQVADDMAAVLKWFGVESLGAWQAMTLDEQRRYHERWAESIEQYLMDGKAPSAELAPLMRRFRAWLVAAYRSLKQFLAGRPDAATMPLNDDIRRVMDRLLATDEQIAQAEEVAGMLPDEEATAQALERQQARSMRDLRWAVKARDKVIADIQRQAEAERRRVRMQVRAEVMSQPVYRVWQFLTGRGDAIDTAPPMVKQGATRELDVTKDSLLVAIAKLGGIARESARRDLGVAEDQFKVESGVFGAPVFRKEGGRGADEMREVLTEFGYLRQFDEFGRTALRELEDLIAEEIGGSPQYSMSYEYSGFLGDSPREQLPVYAAFGKLDTDALRGWFGEGPDALWRRLSERRMTSDKAGVHPDVVADAFEFADGREMVKAIAQARPPREVIDELTEQRMMEEHGDLVDERAIQEAANEAVHNEARARALATELRAQADLLGQRDDTGQTNAGGARITVNAMAEAARQFGAGVAARTVLKDLRDRIWQHTAAERRAAIRWQTATATGQTHEAVKAKQDQVLNNAAARALVDAKDEAAKILDFFRRVTKGGNEKTVERGRDPDIVNAARAVLAAYGVDTGTTRAAGDYLDKLKTHDPETWNVVAPMVADATQSAQPLQALTIEQLQGLHEQVQAMWHLARRSRQLEVDGNLMDIDDAAAELSQRLEEIGVPREVPGETGAVTKHQERVRWLQFAGSLLRRVEQWAEGMDGRYGGPFLRYVFQPVKDAADRYRADRIAYRRKFQALVDAVAPHMPPGLIQAPELGYTFGKGHNGIGMAELLHAILHTGNESNKRKLLLGRKWALMTEGGEVDTRRWTEFIDRLIREGTLRREHFDFAQGVWDLLEETKPLAQQTHRDVFGTYFDEITASPVTNALGTWRGGYVPAQADPTIVDDASLRALAEAENESMAYSFPATNRGFTRGRVEYNRPLKLDLRTIPQHIDKVLLFSHLEAPVRSVTRLLRKSDVSKPLGRIDPSIYSGMLLPWLNRSARQQVETPIIGDGRISRVLSAMRNRAGAALMFANVSNTLQQISGLSSAMVKVRPTLLLRSAAQYISSPRKVAGAVAEASPYMADRMSNEVAAMNDEMQRILLDPSAYERAQAWTQRHAYFLQSAFDNVLSPIVWTGAYNQAIADGMAEKDAVRFADGTVRQTQGSRLPEDVSRIETGPAYARVFTQFVGYFNMMANTNATALQQVAREVGLRKGAGGALYVLTMGMLVPLWVAEAIAQAFRGGPGDDDKDGEYLDDWLAAVFGMGTIKGMLAQVPFFGQLVNAGINRLNDNPADDRVSLSPAVSLLEAGAGSPMSVYKAIADDGSKQKAVRDVASLLSVVTGLPIAAAARPIGYAAGVADDRIEPTSAADAVRGAITGVASKDSRSR